jgi:hypothetical protein
VRARRGDVFGGEAIVGWVVEVPYFLRDLRCEHSLCVAARKPALRRGYTQARSCGAGNILDVAAAISSPEIAPPIAGTRRVGEQHEFRPTGNQLELFCYRLERLTCLGIDPYKRKGTILHSEGQIVAFSIPGRVILGGDGAPDEEGVRFAVLRRIDQDVPALR